MLISDDGNYGLTSISLMFRDFSCETLCVDTIISPPRGILCVDKIGSADRGILCVDKIGSPEIPQDPCRGRYPVGRYLFAANPSRLSPGEDPRVGWYCYRATQSRRSHLTYTPTERAHTDPKKLSFGKKTSCEISRQTRRC